jgi:hypothetical protein
MLTLIRGRFDLGMRVGDRVHLKDTTGSPMAEHGQDGDGAGAFQVTTCLATETSTSRERQTCREKENGRANSMKIAVAEALGDVIHRLLQIPFRVFQSAGCFLDPPLDMCYFQIIPFPPKKHSLS